MKDIDGNKLVEALSLPSHDIKVLELLELFSLQRPVKDEDYDGSQIDLYIDDDGSGFSFNEDSDTEKQKKMTYGVVEFYLNGLGMNINNNVSPPLGVNWNDSYKNITNKFGKKADFLMKYSKKKRIWLMEDSEKKFLFGATFNNEKLDKLLAFWLVAYNDEREYTMPINDE